MEKGHLNLKLSKKGEFHYLRQCFITKYYSGGLGLIPVVLIAAILAGSGCHVIKKDTAADIAELTRFIDDLKGNAKYNFLSQNNISPLNYNVNYLKVRNSETLELVTSLRAAVVQKDAMIENLGKSLKATEDQALAVSFMLLGAYFCYFFMTKNSFIQNTINSHGIYSLYELFSYW